MRKVKISKYIKKKFKRFLSSTGYEIRRIKNFNLIDQLYMRPVGQMECFLEDLKLRGLDCKSILDIGANRTKWSRMAKNVFPEANFYLIEPQIEMEPYLKSFVGIFKGSEYFLYGAGDKNDILTFTIWDDFSGSSFLPTENKTLLHKGEQRRIEIIKIDDLLNSERILLPEIVKIDIQGFELEALKGALKTFGYTEVYIIEVSLFPFSDNPVMPVISDVINFMLDRGYVVYDFAGFLRRPLDGALGQCDICFVKANGFLRKSNEWK